MTLVQFDTFYEFVHRGIKIQDVPPLWFAPRGNTALLDAIGRAIVETGERLAKMPEHERPAKVVFVILTDGGENSSCEYTKDRVNEMIKHQQEKYSWQFVFLGANQDAIQAGMSFGIPAANSIKYAHNAKGVNAVFRATSMNLSTYRTGGSTTMAYSSTDRAEADKKEDDDEDFLRSLKS